MQPACRELEWPEGARPGIQYRLNLHSCLQQVGFSSKLHKRAALLDSAFSAFVLAGSASLALRLPRDLAHICVLQRGHAITARGKPRDRARTGTHTTTITSVAADQTPGKRKRRISPPRAGGRAHPAESSLADTAPV